MITNKAYLSDIKVTNISKSCTHDMAVKASRHRYGTKLRHDQTVGGDSDARLADVELASVTLTAVKFPSLVLITCCRSNTPAPQVCMPNTTTTMHSRFRTTPLNACTYATHTHTTLRTASLLPPTE